MRRTGVLLSLLLLATAAGGCLGQDDIGHEPGDHEPGQATPIGDENATGGPGREQTPWPPLEDALIRPGVRIGVWVTDDPTADPWWSCTTNFLFASPDNRTLYLGTAAHCTDDLSPGSEVPIAGGAAIGTLAYNAWHAMAELDGVTDEASRVFHDFALIEVREEDRGLVHPAFLHFGGPTGLAPSGSWAPDEKVLSLMNSTSRPPADQATWNEGFVTDHPDEWTTWALFGLGAFPGDSGSGVMTSEGEALGIVARLGYSSPEIAGRAGIASLDPALTYARDRAGLDVRLVTWPLLDDGLLPERSPIGASSRWP